MVDLSVNLNLCSVNDYAVYTQVYNSLHISSEGIYNCIEMYFMITKKAVHDYAL